MGMEIIQTTRDILRALSPGTLHGLFRLDKFDRKVFRARFYHLRSIMKIRRKIQRKEAIRVLFIDTETAKWKTQSLYEMMNSSEYFDPVVGISIRDSDIRKSSSEIKDGMAAARRFHDRLGNRCVDVYDCEKNQRKNLLDFAPDMIFYQQPWSNEDVHDIMRIYRKVLPCYVPYYVPSYGAIDIEAKLPFHRFLAFYFVLNDAWITEYRRGVHAWFWSGRMASVGHTAFDELQKYPPMNESVKRVIYAPHFTISKTSDKFKPVVRLSTFLENGREILQYAKAHRDVQWVFKPHPALKTALVDSGAWTQAEVNAYFSEWGEIGTVVDTGDYMRLFASSSVMVTDCGSFLPEFAATGKPLIHLICSRNNMSPAAPSRDVFSTFYEVRNLEEMFSCFRTVIEEGADPKKDVRLQAVKRANLLGQNAARNIMRHFEREFDIKR